MPPTKTFGDLGERASFRVRKSQLGRSARPQNSILGSQAFALREQALIHQSCRLVDTPVARFSR